ncbi:MAG TPA: sigma-70 family RNA polymerase sigma factor [Kofleriaceae bacterium]|nr:sigma-70 family RNA polymerase sigma factor [Kofleriaceae bacterium]
MRERDGTDEDTGPNPIVDDAEAMIRRCVEAGDAEAATTRALERYGPELLGFLRALARDDDLAAEAFANTSEALWKSLPRFRWQASLRTWLYQIARNSLFHVRADPKRRADRNLPLSVIASVEQVQRSATAPYQRTHVKDGMRALRESLDPVDHEILILRLDRGMSWRDIARALAETAEPESRAVLDARAASLRKRFERTKARLRELAIEHGLVTTEDD